MSHRKAILRLEADRKVGNRKRKIGLRRSHRGAGDEAELQAGLVDPLLVGVASAGEDVPEAVGVVRAVVHSDRIGLLRPEVLNTPVQSTDVLVTPSDLGLSAKKRARHPQRV